MAKLRANPTIKLDGKTYELSPTLRANELLDSVLGGLAPAEEAVARVNLTNCAWIVMCAHAGSSDAPMDGSAHAGIHEALWRMPVAERRPVLADLLKYVRCLNNGGQWPEDVDKAAAGETKSDKGSDEKAGAGNG